MPSPDPFPSPIPLKKLIGPSFIILALGLGSGEVILWPYLSSNFGLGIAWGALLGITFQFFMNMEIERYALIKGESVFVGLAKKWRVAPYWFILSTFIGFGLPGIIAASAQVIGSLFGIVVFKWIAIALLIVIGLMLSFGKTVYGMMEKTTQIIIFIAVPFLLILAIIISGSADWAALAHGLIGKGDGYRWLPEGIVFASFFAAFAYSGAGGNLNLTQSIYVKEKGYGMGKYAQKISGLFRNTGTPQEVQLEGESFDMTKENIANFKAWWRRINMEHLCVFWFLGALSMLLLMLLSYVTTFGREGNAQGIHFVIQEGLTLGKTISPIIGTLFLVAVGVMLFQTQLGILDSTSRIMAENAALKVMAHKKTKRIALSKYYYIFLWSQIAFGIVLFLLDITEPRLLITTGAILNAVAMFVHVGLVNWMNHKVLPKELQAAWWRKAIIILIFIVFGLFSGYTVWDKLL
ncbi:MAG: Nramp family divalent metal transporter [Candidatus Magasanikbacteria bacterium]|nr:Nramp family divalent metal transporter [Candidatus Magasanikbacteria bacterium]